MVGAKVARLTRPSYRVSSLESFAVHGRRGCQSRSREVRVGHGRSREVAEGHGRLQEVEGGRGRSLEDE